MPGFSRLDLGSETFLRQKCTLMLFFFPQANRLDAKLCGPCKTREEPDELSVVFVQNQCGNPFVRSDEGERVSESKRKGTVGSTPKRDCQTCADVLAIGTCKKASQFIRDFF